MSKQLSLFEVRPTLRVLQPDRPLMSEETLLKWKSQIFQYQQKTLKTEQPQQTSLFDTPKSHCDTNSIDPFEL